VKTLAVAACLSLWPGLLGAPAEAGDAAAGSANVTVRLVSEVLSIRPGKPFTVALQLKMAPSWHTYWKNPGDSGMPTRVVWTLPDGFKASELQWPTPTRAVDGGLALYGYEREAILLTEITPGSDLPNGRFTLAAKMSWLECKDICIPGKASLDITLPTAPGHGPAAVDPASKALFASARASMPRTSGALKVSHAVEGDRLVLRIAGPSQSLGSPLEFFPEKAGLIEAAQPQSVSRSGTGWAISMKRAANAPTGAPTLRGVLVTNSGSRRLAFEISAAAAPSNH
jgi:DsbC/DsbD-like thiol-disulfide interchange protein